MLEHLRSQSGIGTVSMDEEKISWLFQDHKTSKKEWLICFAYVCVSLHFSLILRDAQPRESVFTTHRFVQNEEPQLP